MKRFQLILIKVLPYAAVALFLFAIMFFGSQHDNQSVKAPIASVFNDASFSVTADQISESYTVANIANAVSLPSTQTISENFVTASAIYESTGTTDTSGTVIERPTIIDVSDLNRRGVITYTTEKGDTIDSILKKLKLKGVTNDQVRWSNGLKKNVQLSPGQKLYLPSVPGIVYVTKKGDTYEGVAKKYGSNLDEMIARNDLEKTNISTGMVLLLPGGVLPEKERPEYVAPRPRYGGNSNPGGSTVIRYSDSGVRHGMFMVHNYAYWRNMYYSTKSWRNPGAFGNCTWFAWYWRRANMPSNYWLPTGAIGNARSWASFLGARGFGVGKTPAYGAVIQTATSGYGHVGVVVGVNPGVNITIQEMNYAGPSGKYNIVYQSTINWSDAVRYNYIYGR